MTTRDATGAAIKPRSPTIAVVLSGAFPGLGQLYNHEKMKALLFAAGAAVTGFGPFSPMDVDIDPGDPMVGMRKVLLTSLPFMAIALWSVIDAYRTAKRTSA
jgi:hypothetical protein